MAGNQSRIAEHYVQIIPIVGQIGAQLGAQITAGLGSSQVSQATQNAGQQIGNDIGNHAGETAGTSMGKKMMAGLAAAAGAAGLAGKIGETVQAGLERMDATAKVTAQLNLNPADAKKLQEAATEVFNGGYGDTFEAVSESMKNIVGSVTDARNLSKDQLVKLSKDFNNVSSAFGIDSEQLGASLNSMIGSGLVSNAEEGLATIAAGFQTLGPSGADFAESLHEFSDDFATLGFKGPEAVGLLSSAIKAGIKDTDGFVDALNEIQIKVADMSADPAIEALGLSPDKVRANFKAGGNVAKQQFKELITDLQKKNDRSLWAGVFGTKAEDYAQAFQNMDLSKAFTPVNGDLEKLDGQLTTINSTLKSLQRTFESAFITAITPILEDVAPKIQQIANFLKENKQVAQALAWVIGGALLISIGLATAALWAMALPVLANPLTWIILGAVAAIGLLVAATIWLGDNWQAVTKGISDAWNGMISGFADGSIWNNIAGAFQVAFLWAINGIIGALNGLIDLANNIKFDIPAALGGGSFGGLNIPKIAPVAMKDGGYVAPRTGGTLALLAEAGSAEAVTGAKQLNNNLDAQTALMQSMAANANQGVTIVVNAAPGQSVQEIAQAIKQLDIFDATR